MTEITRINSSRRSGIVCNILRDDGLSYGDYVEQLTFLLFLKMADEQSRAPFNNKRSPIPKDFNWQSLIKRDGDELEAAGWQSFRKPARYRIVDETEQPKA